MPGSSVGLHIRAFNWHLFRAREHLGLSQAEVGARAGGLSQKTISAIETLRTWPDDETQIQIAIALGRPADELFPEDLGERVRANRGAPTSLRFEAPLTILSLDDPRNALLLPPGDDGGLDEAERRADGERGTAALWRAVRSLRPREQAILRLRFGLDGQEPMTLREVADLYGLTHSRIGQIEAKALRKLRHPSRSRALKPFAPEAIYK